MVRELTADDDSPASPRRDGYGGGELRDGIVSAVLGVVGTLVAPTAVVVGLLYFFGWVRTQAIFSYFGVDTRLIDYSSADYVLRSSEILFDSLIRLAFVALFMAGFHRVVVLRAIHMPARSRARGAISWFLVGGHVVGVFLATVVLVGVLFPEEVGSRLGLRLPILLMTSVALFGYVTYIWSTYPQTLTMAPTTKDADHGVDCDENRGIASGSVDDSHGGVSNGWRRGNRLFGAIGWLYGMGFPRRTVSHSRVWSLLLPCIGLVGVLWAVSLYAYQNGETYAIRFSADLPDQSAVVLYSAQRLAVNGSGIKVTPIVQPGNRYHYQYKGLRLLARSVHEYLLLPQYWQRGRDSVFIIRNDDSIRIDVIAR